MARGTVKWFNDTKGFGFTKQDGKHLSMFSATGNPTFL
jgi:cold shock CspA family protein